MKSLTGETRTYGQIAVQAGNPKAARAVGQANHNNPIPIIVPCHRVIGANGKLVGFGGGLEMKRQLLMLEGWKPKGGRGTVPLYAEKMIFSASPNYI